MKVSTLGALFRKNRFLLVFFLLLLNTGRAQQTQVGHSSIHHLNGGGQWDRRILR
jgi:hypothetical protein